VTKSVRPSNPKPGDTITYTITVVNTDSQWPLPDVNVADLLPQVVDYVSAQASQESYDPTSGDWSVGDLDPEASATLTITMKVTAAPGTTVTNTATATDADGHEDEASATFTVATPSAPPGGGTTPTPPATGGGQTPPPSGGGTVTPPPPAAAPGTGPSTQPGSGEVTTTPQQPAAGPGTLPFTGGTYTPTVLLGLLLILMGFFIWRRQGVTKERRAKGGERAKAPSLFFARGGIRQILSKIGCLMSRMGWKLAPFFVGLLGFLWSRPVWAEEGTFEVMPPTPCAHPCQVSESGIFAFPYGILVLAGIVLLVGLGVWSWRRCRRQGADELPPGANP